MLSREQLETTLARIDGRGYKAYQDLQGDYDLGRFHLHIDKVQSDPFAPPSRIRISISQEVAKFPAELLDNPPWGSEAPPLKIALEDFLIRQFHSQCVKNRGQRSGTGNSGLLTIDPCGQEILIRSAVQVNPKRIEARALVGMPARGRTIMGRQAATLLLKILPRLAEHSLIYANLPQDALYKHIHCFADQCYLRRQLTKHDLIAFVANGSILPRASGVSNEPLPHDQATPFISPPELEWEFTLPHLGPVKGMGIPQGVTLIVGGGYHGKSTLLTALQAGVYNHIPGDGRELVLTESSAVKIKAEDGRSVQGVDISPFINDLPQGRSTVNFCTENASGSTSQAANIMEALEGGAKLLLLDEDTSATNFMIRDSRMQHLVSKEFEPITPFIDRIQELYTTLGVSSILVLGGSGDYFDVADNIIMLREFQPLLVTEQAKKIARLLPNKRLPENKAPINTPEKRIIAGKSMQLGIRSKVRAKDIGTILFDREPIDLSSLEQLISPSQTRAIAQILIKLAQQSQNRDPDLQEAVDQIIRQVAEKGLDCLSPNPKRPYGDLALPRKQEILAAINRLRRLRVKRS